MAASLARILHRASVTVLVWTGALALGLADMLVTRAIPGPPAVYAVVSVVLACLAGGVLGLALVRAVVNGVVGWRTAHRRAPTGGAAAAGTAPGVADAAVPGAPPVGRGAPAAGAPAANPVLSDEAIAREAAWGIRALEAYLARQDRAGGR